MNNNIKAGVMFTIMIHEQQQWKSIYPPNRIGLDKVFPKIYLN